MRWVVQFRFLKAYAIGLDFTDYDIKILSIWPKPSDVPLEDRGCHHFLEDACWGRSPAGFIAGDTRPRFSLPGPDRSRRTLVLGVRIGVGRNVGTTSTVRFDNWWVCECVCGGALAPAPLAVELTEDLVWEPPGMVRVWALITGAGQVGVLPVCPQAGRIGAQQADNPVACQVEVQPTVSFGTVCLLCPGLILLGLSAGQVIP